MQDTGAKPRERVLDPISRISEILFGLIMALTFTGTLSAATAGREEVRTLLFGALGCNIAWGLVDAVMFLMSSLTERGRDLVTIRAVRGAASAEEARAVMTSAVPSVLMPILTTDDFESVRQSALQMRDFPPAPALTKEDGLGALAVFLLVFFSTFPIVIPFLVFHNVQLAMRTSNLVAIMMLFACGYWLARHGGYHPWRTGFSMVVLGAVLVGIVIALGG
jgi:VIT1/CCC1 family predicted Fe2+/Mn2+ transporter